MSLIVEVGGGGAGLNAAQARQAQPIRGLRARAVRIRQGLGLARHGQSSGSPSSALHRQHRQESGRKSRSARSWLIAAGGDAHSGVQIVGADDGSPQIPRDEFLAFCDDLENQDEERLVERCRLPLWPRSSR